MTDHPQDLLTKALIRQQRNDRIWRTIRSFLWATIALFYAYLIFGSSHHTSNEGHEPYAALVRLEGSIMANRPFSVHNALPLIEKAFKDQAAKGVILVINSAGGSASQASIIHDRLLQLKKQYHKKVIVVGEDALASGAYLIACAADKIFVNRDTLTGSIGVIMSGFGFVDAIGKLGITRRVFTAGDNKNRLDPFAQPTPQDTQKIKSLLDIVHHSFIQDVIKGRGQRLHTDPRILFSGDFWTGQTALQLGLVDGLSDQWNAIKESFGATHVRDYSHQRSWVENVLKTTANKLHLELDPNFSIQASAY